MKLDQKLREMDGEQAKAILRDLIGSMFGLTCNEDGAWETFDPGAQLNADAWNNVLTTLDTYDVLPKEEDKQ